MKIYFAGSIRAGRQDAEIYRQLIIELQQFGTILTEHVGSDLPETGETLPSVEIYRRDCAWLDSADAVVAEVTQPSTGVGYEIGRAEAHHIPVYCLFRPSSGKRISGMIEGNPYCTVITYTTIHDAIEQLRKLIQQ